jgi:hypothetical protein
MFGCDEDGQEYDLGFLAEETVHLVHAVDDDEESGRLWQLSDEAAEEYGSCRALGCVKHLFSVVSGALKEGSFSGEFGHVKVVLLEYLADESVEKGPDARWLASFEWPKMLTAKLHGRQSFG